MERAVSFLAWILAGLCAAVVVVLLAMGQLVVEPTQPLDWVDTLLFTAIPVSFAVTSAAILSRQPRNAVGWVLMVPAVSFVLSLTIQTYFGGFDGAPTPVSWWQLALLMFENFSWVLLIFPIFHLMLIFPNGRLLSPRWKAVVWLEAAMILVMVFLSVFGVEIGLVEGSSWTVANPIGWLPTDSFTGVIAGVWSVGLVAITIAGVVGLILRFKRSGPVERQQSKWMLVAVVQFGVVYIANAALSDFEAGEVADIMLGVSLNLPAIAIAFGVLKYRLFDIDRFVSRTVGYAVVLGLLVLVYVGFAVWLPSRFVAGDSPIFVAGATLTVAALFNPLRRAVLRWVDHRFYRSRYDMDRLVEEFGSRVQNETDVSDLTADWVGVVTKTLQPSAIGVWIKG